MRPSVRHSPLPAALITALPLALALGATPAHACSLAPPWAYRHPSRLAFLGTPTADTVFAGTGTMPFVEAPGHFGRGTARAVHGQRVRVDRLGARARRALPAGVREVLLVPWDYAADCRPVPWGRSARWLPDSMSGLFTATLRPREHWAGDLPTLDITPFLQPYRDPSPDTTVRDGLPRPRLGVERLLRLYDELWEPDARLDTVQALAWAERLRADTSLAGRYPATAFIHEALGVFNAARLQALRIPVAGTFRLEVTIDSQPTRLLYVRTVARPTYATPSFRTGGDTTLAPPNPRSYDLLATAAPLIDRLAPSCQYGGDRTIAYVYMPWHGQPAPNGAGVWDGAFDERLFPAMLSAEERRLMQDRVRAASVARMDSMTKARLAGVRPPPTPPYQPTYPMRFTQDPTGPMRVDGTIALAHLGTARVRGERISRETLPCGP